MARPKKDKALGAFAFLGIRISAELRGRIERLAADHGRVLAEEVRHALEDYANRAQTKSGAKSK